MAPAGAEAAPGRDSVSYVALSSKGRGGSSGGGFSKSRGYQKSSGGGSSYRHYPGSSYSGKGKMPLWQAFLVLFLWGGLMVWGIVKLVRKFRKSVNA
ncbi:hypothetical protein [Streptomyces sp. NPDC001401]|uniref:hypothetical protein n=1 Tax=Streptomyces sp. NPDC001401 TaxID=3364570 RepID=UPI0036948BAE